MGPKYGYGFRSNYTQGHSWENGDGIKEQLYGYNSDFHNLIHAEQI